MYEMKETNLRAFVLAGKAILTLVDTMEDIRYTYRVRKRKDKRSEGNVWFVDILVGKNNMSDYKYTCYFKEDLKIKTSQRSIVKDMKDKRISMFKSMIAGIDTLPNDISWLKVYNMGTCGRCGKPLTVPSSIESGLGPECVKLSR